MNTPYEILVPDETRVRLAEYETAIRAGAIQPGARLAVALRDEADFLTALLHTKLPQIFAESAVAGDGSDWNLTELGLLGDISVAMDVTVFDDGRHSGPEVFDQPFEAGLVFVPGALLRTGGAGQVSGLGRGCGCPGPDQSGCLRCPLRPAVAARVSLD